MNDGRGFRLGRPVAMNGAPTGNVLLNDGRKFRRGHPVAMNGDPTGLCTFVGCVFIRTRKMCTAVSKPSAITEAG